MVRVDAVRIGFVKNLFVETGCEAAEATLKAELFYAAFIGLRAMATIKPIDIARRMNGLLALLRSPAPRAQ